MAAIAITLADIVVYVPIAFVSGTIGQLFRQYGLTIVIATLFSLLISFTLTPMLASRWLRHEQDVVGARQRARQIAGLIGFEAQDQVRIATQHLTVAFDCTLVALALSVVVMYLIHVIQREEEWLVTDCQQYCLEHLVGRLYDPEPEHAPADGRFLRA